MDSPRYGPLPQRTNNVSLIDFAIEIIHSQPPISEQRTENMLPKDKKLYKIVSKRRQIEASGGKCDISFLKRDCSSWIDTN